MSQANRIESALTALATELDRLNRLMPLQKAVALCLKQIDELVGLGVSFPVIAKALTTTTRQGTPVSGTYLRNLVARARRAAPTPVPAPLHVPPAAPKTSHWPQKPVDKARVLAEMDTALAARRRSDA